MIQELRDPQGCCTGDPLAHGDSCDPTVPALGAVSESKGTVSVSLVLSCILLVPVLDPPRAQG